MDFQKLVEVYEELEQTSSGNAMREILAPFLKRLPSKDIAMFTYLTLGEISSGYEGVVLGLAEKSMVKAVSLAGGTDTSKVKKILKETGDIGLTAEKILQKKPQTLVPVGKLSVEEVFEKLQRVSEITGVGSQDDKSKILVTLLQKASPKGAKYVCRIVMGTLRMGVGDMTVLDALAIAYTGEK